MVNYCPHCGRRVSSKEDDRCVACGESLPLASSLSMWGSMLRWLGFQFGRSPTRKTAQRVRVEKRTKYVWNDPMTGKERTATSLDDVPPEVRRQMASLYDKAKPEDLQEMPPATFVFRDPLGNERTYNSLDEMPSDVRAMFEQFRRKHGGPP